MNDLRFACPQCEQHIECDPAYGGLEIDCPACSARMVAPEIEVIAPQPQPSIALKGTRCPGCRSSLPAGTVVCTSCGFNLKTGGRMQTQFVSQTAADTRGRQGPVRERSTSTSVWATTLLFLGFFLVGMMNVYAAGAYLGVVWLFTFVICIMTLIAAFRDSVFQFLLTFFVPFYNFYFVFIRNDDRRLKFLLSVSIITSLSVFPLGYRWLSVLAKHAEAAAREEIEKGNGMEIAMKFDGNSRPSTGRMLSPQSQEWTALNWKLVAVSSNPRIPCRTGIILTGNDRYRLYPCPTDTWNTSPARWSSVDYQGHVSESERMKNGRPYLQLCYRVGNSATKAVQSGEEIIGNGRLYLFPSDALDRTANHAKNQGSIRVKIAKVN